MIADELYSFYNKFVFIKKKGYVKSSRFGSTGVGKTFEDLIGKDENTSYLPDYNGLEIKTGLAYSKSNLKLFNLTPKSDSLYATQRLKDLYGYPDSQFRNKKILNVTFNCAEYTLVARKYYFKLEVCRQEKKIYLKVYNKNYELIDDTTYWNFDELINRLYSKLNFLAVIDAYDNRIRCDTYYKYTNLNLYRIREFENFLICVEKGFIEVSLKLGVFRTGKRLGEVHDRGTSFELKKDYIPLLFSKLEL